MKQFFSTFYSDFQHFPNLSIRQITFIFYLYHRFQPNFTQTLRTALTDVHVCPILVIIGIPKQEIPYCLCCYIQ